MKSKKWCSLFSIVLILLVAACSIIEPGTDPFDPSPISEKGVTAAKVGAFVATTSTVPSGLKVSVKDNFNARNIKESKTIVLSKTNGTELFYSTVSLNSDYGFSPDGKVFCVLSIGSTILGQDDFIVITFTDTATGTINRMQLPKGTTYELSFSPNMDVFAIVIKTTSIPGQAVGENANVVLYKVPTCTAINPSGSDFPNYTFVSLETKPDGHYVNYKNKVTDAAASKSKKIADIQGSSTGPVVPPPAPAPQPVTVPLYRYRTSNTSQHFYTTNYGELGIGKDGYIYEGIQGYIYQVKPSSTIWNTTPLYRYCSVNTNDHFYTTDWNELGNGKHGYIYEGIQGYVCTKINYTGTGGADLNAAQTALLLPLYRYWNGYFNDHFYTTTWDELGYGKYGYVYEGVQCYVLKQ